MAKKDTASATSSERPKIVRTARLSALALLALTASSTLLAGCPKSLTCQDFGCASTQICAQQDDGSFTCVKPESDCRNDPTICSADEFCSRSLGRCLSANQQCGRDLAQCPFGQECDAEAGVCQPIGLCTSDNDCDAGEQCGLTGECEPIPCESNRDCGLAGFACNEGRCVVGCALPDAPCPDGSFCRTSGAVLGECITGCDRDSDCDFGFRCDLTATQPTCLAEEPCETDSECRLDEECRDARCRQAPCENDSDCARGQSCERSQCVGGDCTEDTFSPNHSQLDATLITQDTEISNLTRCAGRPDWFELEMRAGESMKVTIQHAAASDLELYLYSEELELLQVDERTQSLATLSYQARSNERVFVVVSSTNFDSTEYDISIERSPDGACDEDSFEENDSFSEAFTVNLFESTPLRLQLSLCPDDEDWFNLGAFEPDEGLSVNARVQQGGFIPTVDVLTPDGELLNVDLLEGLSITRAGLRGDYYLRLSATRRQGGDLVATLTRQPRYNCQGANDFATSEEARPLAPSTSLTSELCALQDTWEVDWYELQEADEASLLDVTATLQGAPPFDMALFTESREFEGELELIRVNSPEEDGTIRLQAFIDPDRRHWLRLSREERPGRCLTPPAYSLRYELSEP